MGAIIAITGKAGAGKSTVLSNLACLYASADTSVGVLSCDLRYSSFPCIFAGMDEIPAQKSLGMLFGSKDLKDTFIEYKHVPNLFISAPASQESCFSYEPPDEEGITNFLELLKSTFDYTIIEAGEVLFNQLSAMSCREADVSVNLVDASLQGIAWEQSCFDMLAILRGGRNIINVLNEPHGPNAIKDIERYLSHGCDTTLRYSKAVYNSARKGLPVMIDANAGLSARRFEKGISLLHALIERMLQQ